jgi:hypothetical protein
MRLSKKGLPSELEFSDGRIVDLRRQFRRLAGFQWDASVI